MRRKATINNPYHRHHSLSGGRNKVQESVGVSETVRVNRFAEGTQAPIFKVKESEPAEERYEIDLSVPFAIVVAFLIALVSVQLSN